MATILTKKSDTASAVPATGDLTHSSGGAELAVNTADKRLFTKNSGGTVVEVGTNPSTLTTATLSVTGNSTLGDASGDSVTINASTVSTPNGLNFDSNTLVIDATNNRVGIGTASPSEMVDISSANTGGTTLELDNTSTGGRNWILYSSGSGNSFGAGKFTIFDGSAGSTRMLIDTSGNVGIGTSSPAAKLVVKQTANTGNKGFIVENSADDSYLSIDYYSTPGSFDIAATYSSTGSYKPITFRTGGSERMRIDSSGNVGIGTTDVSGFLGTTKCVVGSGSGSAGVTVYSGTTSAGYFAFGDATSGAATYDGLVEYDQNGRSMRLYTAQTERMRITSAGEVLVGGTTAISSAASTVNIQGTGNQLLYFYRNDTTISSGDAFGQIGFYGNDTTSNTPTKLAYIQAEASGTHGAGDNPTDITFGTTPDGSATVAEVVRFTQAGKVGIGTSSPDQKLHVYGNTGNTILAVGDNTLTEPYVYIKADATNNVGSITTRSNHPLVFDTNNTERMRIDSSGNLLVGCTTQVSSTVPGISTVHASGDYWVLDIGNTRTTSQKTMRFFNGNGEVGSISTNASATSYTTSSDYRLKENIAPMTGALNVVSQLNPVTFEWKSDGSASQGFVAHELQAVVPDCVTGEKDAVDADGKPVYQGIDTSFLVATLTAAIKELKAENDALKARLDAAGL